MTSLINNKIASYSKKILFELLELEPLNSPNNKQRELLIWQLCEYINYLEMQEQLAFVTSIINSNDMKDRFHACYAIGRSGRAEYYEHLFSQLRLPDSEGPLMPMVKKEARKALRNILKKKVGDHDIMQMKALLRRLMEKAVTDEDILALEKPWRRLLNLEKIYEEKGPSAGLTMISSDRGIIISDGPLTEEQVREMESAELIGFVPDLFQKSAKR